MTRNQYCRQAGAAVMFSLGLLGAAMPAWAYSDGPAPRPPELVTAEHNLDSGRAADAIAPLLAYLKQDPQNSDALTDLGRAYLQMKNYEKAKYYLEQSLAAEKSRPDTNHYLGSAYLATGELDKAEARLATLNHLCFFGCGDERVLKAEVADYKKAHGIPAAKP